MFCFKYCNVYFYNKGYLCKYYFSVREIEGFKNYSTGAAQPQITLDNIKNVKLKIIENNSLEKLLDYINLIFVENEKLKLLKSKYLELFF